MSTEFNEIKKLIARLENHINIIGHKIESTERKVNHIINFLEEFLAGNQLEDYDEDENNQDIYDSEESWVQDPDAWKDEDYYSEDDEEKF